MSPAATHEDPAALLRSQGLRVTRPRVAVMTALAGAPHSGAEGLLTADDHHHLVCRSCGAVLDVDRAAGTAPCLDLRSDHPPTHGFVVDEAEVTWWGHRPACSPAAVPAPSRTSSPSIPHKE